MHLLYMIIQMDQKLPKKFSMANEVKVTEEKMNF